MKIDNQKMKHNIWLLTEMIFLLVAVWGPYILDMNRLSAGETINIAFDWMGMGVLIVMLNTCVRGRRTKSSDSFMKLTVLVFLTLFFEVGTWAVDKLPGLRIVNYISNIGSNTAMLLSTVAYVDFLHDSLGLIREKRGRLYRSVKIVAVLGIAAEYLNIPFGYFYTVDKAGVYRSNQIGSLIGYLPFIYILGYSFYMALKQNIPVMKKVNYLSYGIIPLMISIWYTITHLPPTLFLSSFVSLLIIYGNIYIRQGEEMEKSLLENAKKDAELAWQRNQLTRSQIKPHFIFNCLGSIEQLCRIDAEEARKAMHRFAKYLRVNMDSMSEQSLVSFSTELEHIRNYVWLEQMRFEEDLEYEEEIETTSFSIPPLSIQPLIENAIKHGMMGKEDGVLKVSLKVHETDGYYEIKVEDDGAGFDVNQKLDDGRSHIGITNVRESLGKMVNGKMMISSNIGHGTLVVILIPKTKDSTASDE